MWKSAFMDWLGLALILAVVFLFLSGTALFTNNEPEPPPLWLKIVGGIGLWGWWVFLLAGFWAFFKNPVRAKDGSEPPTK